MKQTYRFILLILCGVGIGVGVGWVWKTATLPGAQPPVTVREVRAGGYKFISPLLECELMGSLGGSSELRSLQNSLGTFVDEKSRQGAATQISIYYRDLNNGPSIGINADADFSPASLLKVPVMMAYFKKAETDPTLLSKKIPFTPGQVLPEDIVSQETAMVPGKSYSVEEYIERMIIYSDNQALVTLEQNIPNELIDKITIDLGIATADANTPEDYMSVKSYASLFRILFNASYLNKDDSESALSILSKVTYTKGLVAGVPPYIAVAHKFGERELIGGIKQLHDCGIVYYPGHPYLLCVMTRGNDLDTLAGIIRSISQTVFAEINRQSN
jgi:beta-lactamase class A